VLALLLALGWPAGPAPAVEDGRVRVALLPLVVRAEERRDALQQGLADMLVARLGRDERLAVIEVEDPAAATTDLEAARATGAARKADYVVFGSFTHLGQGAGLELRCARLDDPDARPREVFAQSESLAGILPLLDGVARRLATQIAGPAPAAPTPAPEAAPRDEGAADRAGDPLR
jgi:TolB-like protein